MYRFCIFLFCKGNASALKQTLDSCVQSSGFIRNGNVEIVAMFCQKKEEVLPQDLKGFNELMESGIDIRCFWEIKRPEIIVEVSNFMERSESEIFLFLKEGDLVDTSYLKCINSFFEVNHEACGVVYLLVTAFADDELSKPFQDLPLGGIISQDKRSLPDSYYGTAVWSNDAKAVGLCENDSNPFMKLVQDVVLQKSILTSLIQFVRTGYTKKTDLSIAIPAREYLVSCIIPIYKVEKYLTEAIDSVLAQTIGFAENVQLILVNDGSPDNCGEICRDYQQRYPNNVVYIEQENQGVSAARNAGLDVAIGEFIAFLDGDDIFDEKYMEAGVAFLQEHGDEVDFVAFPLKLFENVREGQTHSLNYKFKETGIVDVQKDCDYIQMHINSIVLKRSAIGDIRFDTRLKYSEDAAVIHDILISKQKYGISVVSWLNHRKRYEENSAVQDKINKDWYRKLLIFPRLMIEKDLEKFGFVSKYTQYLVMYDIQWHKDDIIPQEISDCINIDELFQELEWIVKYIDNDIIKWAQYISYWQKFYLLKLKNKEVHFQHRSKRRPEFFLGDMRFESLNPVVWIAVVEEHDGIVSISGSYHLAIHDYFCMVILYNGVWYESTKIKNKYKSEYFLGRIVDEACIFDFSIPYSGEGELEFFIRAEGVGQFPIRLKYTFASRLRDKDGSFMLGDQAIIYRTDKDNILKIESFSHTALSAAINDYIKRSFQISEFDEDIRLLQAYVRLYHIMSKRNIWIFMDRSDKADDNAEHLFRYCMGKDDGVEKYFVIEESSPDAEHIKQIGNVIYYGTNEHKLLHLFASKYISSHFDFKYRNPFGSNKHIELFQGLVNSKFVFLQHGITKDDMSPLLNRWVSSNSKVFITAAYMEYNSIIDDYGYGGNVVKLTGFPRYDNLYDNKQKQIVFMPSWRRKLTIGNLEYQYNSNFKKSLYCQKINAFLSDNRLINTAKQLGYKLLFLPHPRMYVQIDDFEADDYVQVVPYEVSYQILYADAALMITDYSSAIFDFAYLKKPVLYYHFFKYHNESSYFNYDTMGFGEVTTQHDELVDLVIHYMETGCVMDEKYQQRVDDFFSYTDRNNCERVYNSIQEI